MSDRIGTVVKSVLVNLVVAAVASSLTFGISMASVAKQVSINTNEIVHLNKADQDLKDQFVAETKRVDLAAFEDRKRSDERIFEATKLMAAHIEQSKELISIIKLQNRVSNP